MTLLKRWVNASTEELDSIQSRLVVPLGEGM